MKRGATSTPPNGQPQCQAPPSGHNDDLHPRDARHSGEQPPSSDACAGAEQRPNRSPTSCGLREPEVLRESRCGPWDRHSPCRRSPWDDRRKWDRRSSCGRRTTCGRRNPRHWCVCRCGAARGRSAVDLGPIWRRLGVDLGIEVANSRTHTHTHTIRWAAPRQGPSRASVDFGPNFRKPTQRPMHVPTRR